MSEYRKERFALDSFHKVSTNQLASHYRESSQIVEGLDKNFGDNDYGIATERQCMERAPSDNQERCAYVKYNHKQVYMCFCKGDLCNSAKELKPPLFVILLTTALFLPYFVFRLNPV